ncbi:MAG TPA: thermonuclease family protein [Clostridia bacterium]|nr:thermonuclease family protein [Clostridia bacterium]
MNLNNYHNRVILRKQKTSFNRLTAISLIAIFVLLIILTATGCHLFIRDHVIGPTKTPTLTAPPTARAGETPLFIPAHRPLTVDEAAAVAERLAVPLETYDLLRTGGSVDFSQFEQVAIERVVDGDTLIVRGDNSSGRLRLIGIDAPESYAHHEDAKRTHTGESVSRIVNAWLDGRDVFLQFDVSKTDPYDRLLAYVWLDRHTMVNEVLVREGLAEERRYPPTTRFNDYFATLEKIAQDENRGIWSNRNP